MATSTEQINQLIGGYTDLKQYFEDVRGTIDAKVADLYAARLNLPAAMRRKVYVDQINGSDGNDGRLESPVSSIGQAMKSCVPLGLLDIVLMTDYEADAARWVMRPGSAVYLRSHSAMNTLHLTMQPSDERDGEVKYEVSGFYGSYEAPPATLQINNVHVKFPEEEQIHPVYGPNYCALFGANGSGGPALMACEIVNSVLEMPSGGEGYVIGARNRNVALAVKGTTQIGNFAGRWVSDIAGGTLTTDAPNVLSNLTSL